MTKFLLGVLLSMTLTLLFTPLVLQVASRRRVGARINGHSIHRGFVPKLGGVATFVAWAVTVVVLNPDGLALTTAGLILGAAVMLLIGVIDDVWELSYRQKLLGQAAAAGLAVALGLVVEAVPLPGGGQLVLGGWGVVLTMLWLVGMSNALNLLDGVDGLAAGTAAIAAVFLWLLGGDVLVAAGVAGASFAFLRYNFHPARMFLGDSGSLVLGFLLAGLAVQGCFSSSEPLRFAAPLFVLSLPLTDTALAFVRRMIQKKHPFRPDRDHIHHRLLAAFANRQPRTVLCLYFVSIIGGLGAISLHSLESIRELSIAGLLAISAPSLVMWLSGRKVAKKTRAAVVPPANGVQVVQIVPEKPVKEVGDVELPMLVPKR
jgi:UDP-GlcNAc:undecaprenyl-phosphate GlcNAc-1-phosphate transferase